MQHLEPVIRAFAACASRSPGECCLPVLGGRGFRGQEAAGSGCGALPVQPLAAVHPSAAGSQVHFHGVSQWIMPLLCPVTHCPC